MSVASQDLRREHEAILYALKVADEMISRMNSGREIPLRDITGLLEFLKLFADTCHHGKEEGIFFPALEEAGVPRHNGPIEVMLSEHARGRNFIREMQEAVLGNRLRKDGFTKAAGDYAALLRSHIDKENNVLFPMGDSRLSDSRQKQILKAFEEFEETVMGKGKHEKIHRMLDDFGKRYLA